MPTISGILDFDKNRSATIDAGDSGLANVPIVLQNKVTGNRLTVLTDANGKYSFINVPNGKYIIVEAYGQIGGIPTPGDFTMATLGPVPVEKNPPISFATNPPVGSTNLDDVTPSTLLVTVSGADLTNQNFLDGPVIYTPITDILDPCAIVDKNNLISVAESGDFGSFPAGTLANTGAPNNPPYPGVTPDFLYVMPNPNIFAPNDGQYTVQNIMNNSHNNGNGTPNADNNWWRIADHTTGTETGRYLLINGFNPGAVFFQEVVTVTPNTNYLFSSWILNMFNGTGFANPALGVIILDQNGESIYNSHLGNLIPVNINVPQWKEIGTVINSGNNTQITVKFVSEGPAAVGNDYAIDDIMLQLIDVPLFIPVKSVSPSTANVGEQVTYTVRLTNTCTSTLTNVFFTDILPPELSFVSGSVTGGTNPITDNPNLGFNVPNIVGGATATITFKANILSSPPSNPVNNTATMNYNYSPVQGGIPNSYTGTSNITPLQINNLADVSVVKTADQSSVIGGNEIEYTMIVANAGPSPALNVTLTDATDCLLNPEYSLDGGETWFTWTGSINLQTIAAGYYVTGLIRGTINPTCTGILTNTATAFSPTPDPNLNNNTSTVTTTILGINKSVDKVFANVGEVITYRVTISNPGKTKVKNLLFKDPVPEGTTYNGNLVVSTGFTGTDPQTGLIITTINPGEIVVITWEVKVGDSVPVRNPISNLGMVTVPGGKPTSTNTVTTTILANTKSVDKVFVNVGEIITYTVTINNPGNEPINNVLFTDPVPAGTTYNENLSVSTVFTGTDPETGLIITTINPGEIVVITWEVLVMNTMPLPNSIQNTGIVTVPGGTATPTNTVNTTVLANTKSVDKSFADIGEVITYTVAITNPGNDYVKDLLFTDPVPAGTTYNNNLYVSTGFTGTDPQTGLTITSINPGKTITITWEVLIGNTIPVPNPIENIGTIKIPAGTASPTNKVTTTVNHADLISKENFIKSVDKQYADIGDEITYTITVKNIGNTIANNIVIIDYIPNGTIFVSGSLSATVAFTGTNPATGITITNGVAPGETINISYRVKVDEIPVPNPIPNTAAISYTYTVDPSHEDGASASGNSNTVRTKVNYGEILPQNAIKSANKSSTTPGDIVTYTVTAKNTGNTPLNSVVIKDAVPFGTTFVQGSVVINGDSKPAEDPAIGINVGAIAPNGIVTVSFKVEVLQTASSILSNIATIDYSYVVAPNKPPTKKSVNTNEVNTPVLFTELTLVKSSDRSGAIVGDTIRYSITATNAGEIPLKNVIVKDPLTPDLAFSNNLTIDGMNSNQNITLGVSIENLAVGESKVITFDAKVISVPIDKLIKNTSSATFKYTISGGTFTGTATSKEVTVIIYSPKLQVDKTASSNVVKVGDIFKYNIIVKNTGDIVLNNVIIKDELPPQFKVQDIKVNGTSFTGDIALGININTLAINQSKTVELTILVTGDLATIFKNVAIVTGEAVTDPNKPPSKVTAEGTDTKGVVVLNSELRLIKSADKSCVVVGEIVTYTVVAKNTGKIIIGNIPVDPVVIFDVLSQELEFIIGSVEINGNPDLLSSIVSGVDIGILDVGESKTITFKAKVISNAISPIYNVSQGTFGFILPGGQPQTGSSKSNKVKLLPEVANIIVKKSADKEFAVLGDTINYTVKLKNTGTLDAINVIFKDILPHIVELIQGTFSVNGAIINSVDIAKGVNIGTVSKDEQVVIKYSVKVIKTNCELQVINQASVKFQYRLPDCRTGSAESEKTSISRVLIKLGIANFKQLSVEENLIIPTVKPNIEAVNDVTGDIEVLKFHMIKTPVIRSNEGQILTGYKLIVHGVINEVIEYTADEAEQSVHSAHYSIPFTTFIVLPENYSSGNVEVHPVVEDIYFKQVDSRTVFANATILIKVAICCC